ncbi:Tumor necrosis factor receptor superfamily member 16 [Liparis tanakae]|uniref:Tumor necrosis factor receptor superfamily member 16 n=1 Tax=Liparis tanakae TaxID=230148 RepID=A0A4Z2EQR1_9TELE|nr:Tumor necrosis factor receptor superfamily member 16 [Liparis tanakae]
MRSSLRLRSAPGCTFSIPSLGPGWTGPLLGWLYRTQREGPSCRLLFKAFYHPLYPTYFPPTSDMDLSPPPFTNYFLPDGSDSPLPGETTTSSAGSPRFLGYGLNENLIPIYCSILAAVVVGLVAYIVFKRSVDRENKETRSRRLNPPVTFKFTNIFYPF